MSHRLPSLRLTGARVLVGDAIGDVALSVEDGHLSNALLPEVDLSGYLVLPGIIDLHGDAFERHMAPRPSAPFPIETGLIATDRDAAANGVTTAFLAQSWSWEGGHRSPDFAEDFLAAHAACQPRMLTDLRVQLRIETHTMDTQTRLVEAIRRWNVTYAIFNNHLPEAVECSVHDPGDFASWAAKSARTPAEQLDIVQSALAREQDVPRYLCNLATVFDQLGVHYGSHDDTNGATRERYSMIGAKICEFPTTIGPALVARAWEDPVLMGAPNVVRGGSQSGNIAATDLIRERVCDALVSDYYYPALSRAAFALVDQELLSFPDAWAMISSTPARILCMKDRGLLAEGLRADLVVLHEETRIIEGTMSAGRWTHLCGDLATRLANPAARLSVAAE